jgi:glycosyltransferase involved in cell wall biosynthesis
LKKGDLVLLGDVWMPGIEAIKFQSDLLGLDIKIGGWHYAGCFDHFDFLAKGLGSWGPKYEQALVEGVLDSVCFGSPFHKAFVERHCRLPRHASTEGLAWDHYEVAAYAVTAPKPKPIVAFTHRWAAEKRHGEFLRLARSHKGKRIQFVISTNGEATPEMIAEAAAWNCRIVQHKTKADYYKWLATVRIMWSGADQETFGYSFMESVALGRKVVAPMRACYPDHFTRLGIDPADWLYNDRDPFGAGMLHRAMTYKNECIVPAEVSLQYHNAHDRYIRQFVEACA